MDPVTLAITIVEEDGAAGTAGEVSEAGRVISGANLQILAQVGQAIAQAGETLTRLITSVQQQPESGAPAQPQQPGQAPATITVQQQAATDPVEMVAQEAVVPLSEAAKGGKGLVKVIDAGWGSSGYYGPTVLERDAPSAFPAGTKMYWDHPTEEEAKKRPERSLRDLAAETTEPAKWMREGPEGPGVYAPIAVFSPYRSAIEELKDHIGVSIRAAAHIRNGEADGKRGPIVERLLPSVTNTVDFVTIPGRGGRVAALFEAARGRNDPSTPMEDTDVSQEELKAAQEAARAAEERAARAEAAAAIMAARGTAAELLAKSGLPALAREVIAARVTTDPPIKEGALDVESFTKVVSDAIAAEKAYIARLTGQGEVRNMGSGVSESDGGSDRSLQEAFVRLGMSEDKAKLAAAGRN